MMFRTTLALTMLGLIAPVASADLYTYTETFNASGSLDGVAFGNASTSSYVQVTLTLTGDTANIVDAPPYLLESQVTINVAGMTDYLSDSVAGVYVNQAGTSSTAGFFDGSTVIMATESGSLSVYDLGYGGNPAISVTGVASTGTDPNFVFGSFNTQNGGTGAFYLTGVYSDTGPPTDTDSLNPTFTAAVVPEPSSLAMTAIAVLLGGAGRWTLKRRAKARASA